MEQRQGSAFKTSGLSELYLSNFSRYVGVFLSRGQQLQEYFHFPGIYNNASERRGTHDEEVLLIAEQNVHGVMEMDVIKTSRQENVVTVCFLIMYIQKLVPLLLLLRFPPLGLISLLHVQTGSSQSQVKLVTRVLHFISPHLYLPFCSSSPRQSSPATWHHE